MIRREPLEPDLFIYRDTEKPGYTADSIQLIRFADLKKNDRVIDLGSGSGILSIYGCYLYDCSFIGVEHDAEQAALALRSARENGQGIDFYAMDVAETPAFFGDGTFTAAICNPPYFTRENPCADVDRNMARHGEKTQMDSFFASAFRLLKNKGRLYVCAPAESLSSLCCTLERNRLIPKVLQPVRSKPEKVPYLVLVEAVKLAGNGLVWKKDICLFSVDETAAD